MSTAGDLAQNPYVGPRAFQRGELFFGRDHEASDLVSLITAERIVLLYSPSGAGKSSLLQAKVIPALEQRKFRVSPVIRVSTTPTVEATNPYIFSALLSLEEAVPITQQLPLDQLARMTFVEYLQLRAVEGSRTLLVFDQFEEILTSDPTDHEVKLAFFAQLGEALENRQRWALFAMREDYLAGLDPYRRQIPSRLQDTYRLDLLGATAARAAIQKPARQNGVEFNESATDRLIEDLCQVIVQGRGGTIERRAGLSIEPVQLQVVCYRLWEGLRPGSTTIGADDLGEVGSVDQALGSYYAARVAAAAEQSDVLEQRVREWCERALITEQGLRGQVQMGPTQSQGLPNAAIQQLVDAYLLRREERRGAIWFELAHDRLVDPLRANNKEWFAANLSPIERKLQIWREQSRPKTLLLRDNDLDEAQRWAETQGDALNDDLREFLVESLEERRQTAQLQQAEERATRNQRRFTVALVILVPVLFGLLVGGFFQLNAAQDAQMTAVAEKENAEAERNRAEAASMRAETAEAIAEERTQEIGAQQLAIRAASFQGVKTDLAMLLNIEAYRRSNTFDTIRQEAQNSLYGGLADTSALITLLQNFVNPPTSVKFSPDSKLLAVGDNRGNLQFWDVAERTRIFEGSVQECSCGINSLSFSPDGALLAIGSANGVIVLFDVAAQNQAIRPLEVGSTVNVVAFNPTNGNQLAVGTRDGRVLVWDLTSLAEPRELGRREQHEISGLAYDPQGTFLATTSNEAAVLLWDVSGQQSVVEMPVVEGNRTINLYRVAISNDGNLLAASGYNTVYMWNLPTRQREGDPLRGHRNFITSLAFKSNNSFFLATAGDDRRLLLWRAYERSLLDEWQAQNDSVTSLDFSSDGRFLATASRDRTVALWSFEETGGIAQRIGGAIQDRLNQLVVNGNEPIALVRRDENLVPYAMYTRRVDEPLETAQIEQRDSERFEDSTGLGLSQNGRRMAAAFENGTVLVYDDRGELLATLRDDQASETASQALYSPTFDHAGQRLAAGHNDGTILVWDLMQPERAPARLTADSKGEQGHSSRIISIAFESNGKYLATGSWDRRVFLWDLETSVSRRLLDAGENIFSLKFSHHGQLLAAGGDQSIYFWDVPTGLPLSPPLTVHSEDVIVLAFNADDTMLATGGLDQQVVLWKIPPLGNGAPPVRFGQPLLITPFAGWVRGLGFTDDERLIVGYEFSTWSIDLRPERWVELACQIAGRNLTAEEWRLYIGDEDQQPTCPGE